MRCAGPVAMTQSLPCCQLAESPTARSAAMSISTSCAEGLWRAATCAAVRIYSTSNSAAMARRMRFTLDLHSADGASIALLGHPTRELRSAPVLLLGTCQDRGSSGSPPLQALLTGLDRQRLPRQHVRGDWPFGDRQPGRCGSLDPRAGQRVGQREPFDDLLCRRSEARGQQSEGGGQVRGADDRRAGTAGAGSGWRDVGGMPHRK